MICLHSGKTEYMTTGSFHLTAGEVWDDLCDHIICLECGQHVDCDSLCEDMRRPWTEE